MAFHPAEVGAAVGAALAAVANRVDEGTMALRSGAVSGTGVSAAARERVRSVLPGARRVVGLLAAAGVVLGLTTAAAAGVTVERYAFATAVEAREPLGEGTTFPADVGRLYFFTRIRGAGEGDRVRHVWIYDGREVADVDLTVSGPVWRTWSSKAVPPSWRGDWTVEVRDAAGAVLATAGCRVE